MPDQRAHRGPHPEDAKLFAPAAHPALRSAVRDLSWLLSRGYADPSALKLVGDRYGLHARQRSAVARSACPDDRRDASLAKRVDPAAVAGRAVLLDGYNVLTTVEAALAGAVVLLARDGAVRDIAAMHGTWRRVEETALAIDLIGRTLADFGVPRAAWFLDRPVSNSGRLAATLRDAAAAAGWAWDVRLVQNPDAVLIAAAAGGGDIGAARVDAEPAVAGTALAETDLANAVAATADSLILDRGGPWLDLAGLVVARHVPAANVVDLRDA